jgi:hypothetical protein
LVRIEYQYQFIDHAAFCVCKAGKEHLLLPYIVDSFASSKTVRFKDTIYFSYDSNIMKDAVSVDMTTLKESEKPFDESNIVGMYIIDAREKFELKINPT